MKATYYPCMLLVQLTGYGFWLTVTDRQDFYKDLSYHGANHQNYAFAEYRR